MGRARSDVRADFYTSVDVAESDATSTAPCVLRSPNSRSDLPTSDVGPAARRDRQTVFDRACAAFRVPFRCRCRRQVEWRSPFLSPSTVCVCLRGPFFSLAQQALLLLLPGLRHPTLPPTLLFLRRERHGEGDVVEVRPLSLSLSLGATLRSRVLSSS